MQEAAAAAAAAAVAASTGDDVLQLEDPEAEEIAEDVLEGLRRLDQGGNKVTWYVYSETPGRTGGAEGYIEKLRSEQLDEARFKTVYGPGEYRIVGRTRDGGYVRGSHKIIKISDIGHAAAPQGGQSDAVSLLREMRAADEQRAAKRAEDLRSYATILATPLATLGAAIISRRPAIDIAALIAALRPQQSTLVEMTTALTNLKQLEGAKESNLDTVLKVLEKINDLPQGNGGDTGWLGFAREVIREAAPHARDIIGQLRAPSVPANGQLPQGAIAGPPFGPGVTPQLPPAAAPQTNGSNGAQAAPAAAPQSNAEGSDMWRLAEPWLRRKAEDLHEAASTNMPVELEAERLLLAAEKKFGQATIASVKGWLVHPDWWVYVVSFHPPLQPYQAWVDDLRGELLALLSDDGQQQERTEQSTESRE